MTLSLYAWSQTHPSVIMKEEHYEVSSIVESDKLASERGAKFHYLYGEYCDFVIVLLADVIHGNNDDFIKTYEN